MALCKVDSIVVIGNVIDEYEKLRASKIEPMRGIMPRFEGNKVICIKCNEEMFSRLGNYNGTSDDDDDGISRRHFEWECKNFHFYSWTEEIKKFECYICEDKEVIKDYVLTELPCPCCRNQ